MDEFAWMEHPDVGVPVRIAAPAVEVWTLRGYRPCNPPAEVDVTQAHKAPEAASEPQPEPDAPAPTTKTKAGPAGEPKEGAE